MWAEEKVNGVPKGVDTNIYKEFDSEGVEFSGGQGQKLAMARTIYKNAPIIILDEPTAALDPIAEHEIYSGFHDIVRDKMVVYISHRLSAVSSVIRLLCCKMGSMRICGICRRSIMGCDG